MSAELNPVYFCKYEDNLYYPFYICHRHVEVSGREVKAWIRNEPVSLTRSEYDNIMSRLNQLEQMVLHR
jgi:hypothetical protein